MRLRRALRGARDVNERRLEGRRQDGRRIGESSLKSMCDEERVFKVVQMLGVGQHLRSEAFRFVHVCIHTKQAFLSHILPRREETIHLLQYLVHAGQIGSVALREIETLMSLRHLGLRVHVLQHPFIAFFKREIYLRLVNDHQIGLKRFGQHRRLFKRCIEAVQERLPKTINWGCGGRRRR